MTAGEPTAGGNGVYRARQAEGICHKHHRIECCQIPYGAYLPVPQS